MSADTEWAAYVAGFFDGEGCFYLGTQKGRNGKNYPKAQILLSQSGSDGLAILQKIQERFGGNLYTHLVAGQHKATKDAYKLWWNKEEGKLLIHALLPYLIIKKQQALDVLKYLERNDGI